MQLAQQTLTTLNLAKLAKVSSDDLFCPTDFLLVLLVLLCLLLHCSRRAALPHGPCTAGEAVRVGASALRRWAREVVRLFYDAPDVEGTIDALQRTHTSHVVTVVAVLLTPKDVAPLLGQGFG